MNKLVTLEIGFRGAKVFVVVVVEDVMATTDIKEMVLTNPDILWELKAIDKGLTHEEYKEEARLLNGNVVGNAKDTEIGIKGHWTVTKGFRLWKAH